MSCSSIDRGRFSFFSYALWAVERRGAGRWTNVYAWNRMAAISWAVIPAMMVNSGPATWPGWPGCGLRVRYDPRETHRKRCGKAMKSHEKPWFPEEDRLQMVDVPWFSLIFHIVSLPWGTGWCPTKASQHHHWLARFCEIPDVFKFFKKVSNL